MIHHVDFAVADFKRSREFYLRALEPLDLRLVMEFQRADDGKDNGAQGERPRYAENYYAACVLDPDGYNVEVVCR